MVTANLYQERRPSSDVIGEDDENSSRQIQNRLDHLYLDNSQHNRHHYQHSQRTLSPCNIHDMYTTANTVPVYRHGRKFYVSMEEFERMRTEHRRQRRTFMQKSQNLPVSKSHQTNLRPPPPPTTTSLYNPISRSTSHPHDYRYGVLRAPHLPMNAIINNNTNNMNRHESIRQSRSTSRYYDDRDDLSSVTSALPMKFSTTAIRSNSSDHVVDRQRTLQPPMPSYGGYVSDDYELKRSYSADIRRTAESHSQRPIILPRRTPPTPVSDYGPSDVSSFPITPIDQTNGSKSPIYFNRPLPSAINSPGKPVDSTFTGTNTIYETNVQDSNPMYASVNISNRRIGSGLTPVSTRSTANNSNHEYYLRDTTNGSFSDDNSSSPSTLIQRRNTDTNRYRRPQLVVETDDDYEQQGEIWGRSTARSQSSDGLTEKKRVRFADMEGFTLETAPNDDEQERPIMNDRLSTRQLHDQMSSNIRGRTQPFRNTFHQATTRVSGNESKLATDV